MTKSDNLPEMLTNPPMDPATINATPTLKRKASAALDDEQMNKRASGPLDSHEELGPLGDKEAADNSGAANDKASTHEDAGTEDEIRIDNEADTHTDVASDHDEPDEVSDKEETQDQDDEEETQDQDDEEVTQDQDEEEETQDQDDEEETQVQDDENDGELDESSDEEEFNGDPSPDRLYENSDPGGDNFTTYVNMYIHEAKRQANPKRKWAKHNMGVLIREIEKLSKKVESGEAWRHRTTESDISFDKEALMWSFIEGMDIIDRVVSNFHLDDYDYIWDWRLDELDEAMNSAGERMLDTLEECRHIFDYFPCTIKWGKESGIDVDA